MKIKARDVEQRFRELGPERASLEIFIIILEHITVMNEQMNELTHTMSKMIDMMGASTAGFADVRRQVERLSRKHMEDDLPDNI
jgi:hypothetical protein